MVNLLNAYNQAINFLHHEQYEEAMILLEEIYIKNPNLPEVGWALGLCYVMCGYPQEALKYWNRISEEKVVNILSSKNTIETKLSLYEELYNKYNRAIEYVQENNFREANLNFQELLSYKEEVPLPIVFYQGYLLSKILIGEEEFLVDEIGDFPQYVRKYSVIRNIQKQLERKQHFKIGETSTKSNGKRKLVYILGLMASMLIGAISINLIEKDEIKMVSSEQQEAFNQKNNFDISKSNKTVADLEVKVNELKSQQKKLQLELESKDIELEKQNRVQKLLNISNIDIKSLSNKTGLLTYKKGMQAYNSGMYQQAVTYFEQSQSIKSDGYFSDDALFFLIQSKKKLNDTDKLVELYDRFLNEKGKSFTLSPYYDDILLAKAEMLVESGKINEATILLSTIKQDFSNEWTALKSIEIMKEISEDENANN